MKTPTFDQAAQNIARHKQAPAADRRQQLAPTRAELETVWKDFLKKKPSLVQRLHAAQVRRQRAAEHGVVHPPLEHAIKEIYGDGFMPGVLASIESRYRAAVARIEQPTATDLNFVNAERGLPGEPSNLRALVGFLDRLVEQIERMTSDGGDLHRRMLEVVPGAPAGQVAAERTPGINTEAAFRV